MLGTRYQSVSDPPNGMPVHMYVCTPYSPISYLPAPTSSNMTESRDGPTLIPRQLRISRSLELDSKVPKHIQTPTSTQQRNVNCKSKWYDNRVQKSIVSLLNPI
jgi:hypothetical protein